MNIKFRNSFIFITQYLLRGNINIVIELLRFSMKRNLILRYILKIIQYTCCVVANIIYHFYIDTNN
jgi:hypothetical protein